MQGGAPFAAGTGTQQVVGKDADAVSARIECGAHGGFVHAARTAGVDGDVCLGGASGKLGSSFEVGRVGVARADNGQCLRRVGERQVADGVKEGRSAGAEVFFQALRVGRIGAGEDAKTSPLPFFQGDGETAAAL